MAIVFVPAPLRRLTGGQTRLEIAAGSVGELLDRLEAAHPGVRGYLLDETGALREYVNLFVGANEVRTLAGLQPRLADDDEVSIIPAMAGGVMRDGPQDP